MMSPLSTRSAIVAADEMLVKNIPQLKNQTLCQDLQDMDENEIKLLLEEEDLDSIRSNVTVLAPSIGVFPGIGIMTFGAITSLWTKIAGGSPFFQQMKWWSIGAIGVGSVVGLITKTSFQRCFNAQEKAKGVAEIRITRLKNKISELEFKISLSYQKYSPTDIKQFYIAKRTFSLLADHYQEIDNCSSPIYEGLSGKHVYGPSGLLRYSGNIPKYEPVHATKTYTNVNGCFSTTNIEHYVDYVHKGDYHRIDEYHPQAQNKYVIKNSTDNKYLTKSPLNNKQNIQLQNNNVSELFIQGFALMRKSQFNEARIQFKIILKIEPQNPRALRGYACSLVALRKFDKAKIQFESFLKIKPLNLIALKGYAKTLFELGKFDEAKIQFESLLKIQSLDACALRVYAKTLFKLRKFDEAKIQFESLLKIEPQNLLALKGYAKTLYKLSKFDEAKIQFESYMNKILNRDTNVLIYYANTLFNLGKFDEAKIQFEYVLRIEPQNVKAQNGYLETVVQLVALKKPQEVSNVRHMGNWAIKGRGELFRLFKDNIDKIWLK